MSDKGCTAQVFIKGMKYWGVPLHLQFSGVGNEIQTIFCRLFDTPIVKVTAMIPDQDNIFEEYNKALLERKKGDAC